MTHSLKIRPASVRALISAVVLVGALAGASAAEATVTPSVSLNQSAGTAAGGTANLGMNLSFSYTGTANDTAKDLTINLPPGLLANASIDGGTCLRRTITTGTACRVGTGTVSANAVVLGLQVPAPALSVDYYLVPPPAAGDLAGLAVEAPLLNEELGSPGDIKVRPSGSPGGVGVTISLVLPSQLPLLGVNLSPIVVNSIDSTFNGLRYPATCPSTPADVSVAANSQADSTLHTATAPLSVTRCSSLAYAPRFQVTATRDSSDPQVQLSTTITQAATEAPSQSVSLAFPTAVLGPNLQSIQVLCLNLASGTCHTVGSAKATSPLYPTALTGRAYLTGSPTGLFLTVVFPQPFALTLSGAVNLVTNAATFTGLPDIPLTALSVTLNGGADGLFRTSCTAPSGTATATLTDQNGDRTVHAPARFTVAGCPGTGGGNGGGSGGSGGGSSGGAGAPAVSTPVLSGAASGRVSLSFRVSVRRHASKLAALTVELPRGLSFVHARRISGVRVTGARVRSLSLSHGHLVIVLRKPARSLLVRIGSRALRESAALQAKARAGKLGRLRLTLVTRNARGKRATVHVLIG